MAWQLADWQLTAGNFEHLRDYETSLDTISADEVAAVLRSYLQNETTVAAGPDSTVTAGALQALF